MSDVVRVIARENGQVSIIMAVADPGGSLNDATTLARLDAAQACQPELAWQPFVDLDPSTLPADRSARSRWRLVDGAVVVVGAAP